MSMRETDDGRAAFYDEVRRYLAWPKCPDHIIEAASRYASSARRVAERVRMWHDGYAR